MPAAAIRELAHAFGNAANPQLCWTLGITEHHNAVDNVFALINLALLVGGVGRYGAGLQPLRGQNNVQGGGDMGAIPNKLPGFQDVTDDAARAKFEAAWGAPIPREPGLHLTGMFEAIEHGELSARLRRRREPRAVGGRQAARGRPARAASTTSSCRTSSSRGRPSSPTSSSPAAPAGRSRRARSPRASGACSACARRSTRRARRATTSRSSTSSRAGSAHDLGSANGRGHLERGSRRSRRCTRA